MVPGAGARGTSVSIHKESFQTSSFTPTPVSGLIWPVADTSLAARITKSGCTERLSFEWKPKKSYFLKVVDTCPELNPGNIIAWSGLIERLRVTLIPPVLAIISMYYTALPCFRLVETLKFVLDIPSAHVTPE